MRILFPKLTLFGALLNPPGMAQAGTKCALAGFAGDLISLGAIGGPLKAEQGRHYTAEYTGYGDGVLTVYVTIQ